MREVTLVYYTASRIKASFASTVRGWLVKHAGGLPIVSVSQEPLDFGRNLCLGPIGASPYNLYRQLLAGAKAARSAYVICCEDDTLYSEEHLRRVPVTDDTFFYNRARWSLESTGAYRWRDSASMCGCIVARELLVDTLERRFESYPEAPPGREAWRTFGEPGRVEHRLGLPSVRMAHFETANPIVTVNHRDSLGGKRKTAASDTYRSALPVWGDARRLWDSLMGGTGA